MATQDTTRAVSTNLSLQDDAAIPLEAFLDVREGRGVIELEPVDRGPSAWRVLIAAFIFEAVFWGFITSFGVFQAYYSSHWRFEKDRQRISVIGTLAQGLVSLGAPFATTLVKQFPRYTRHFIVTGWVFCIVGLLAASFATTVAGLIASQGLLYGSGFLMLIFPILNLVSEWWNVRRGMAFGILSSASGVTGAFMPVSINTLLHRYGYQTTLQACAVAMFICTAPLIPLLKGRQPVSEVFTRPPTDLSFFKEPFFWFFAGAVTIQGLGFFIPPVFVPTYAESVGLPSVQAALLLTAMAIAQTAGQSALGWLSDSRIHVSVLAAACCGVAALATALLWGMAKSLWSLMLYSIIYGFFAYGFGTLRVAMGRLVSSEQSTTLATYSCFVFLQGIGTILVGPITAELMTRKFDVTKYGASMYGTTVIFVAVSSTVGGIFSIAPCLLGYASTASG